MNMVRMSIRSIVVSGGPVPSALVLAPAKEERGGDWGVLPISIGAVESSSIGMGVAGKKLPRPMTHDLLLDVVERLGAKLESVSITRVEATTFYANLTLTDVKGETLSVDARPSDAIALAVRRHVPIFASEEVLRTASIPDFDGIKRQEQEQELEEFHDFVEQLSPEDFTTTK